MKNIKYIALMLLSYCGFFLSVQGAVQLSDGIPYFYYIGDEHYEISPDGLWVVYEKHPYIPINNTVGTEIFSVSINGGINTRLNVPLSVERDVTAFQINPGSSNVVYLADQDTNEVHELYQVPINGGTITKLNVPLPSLGDVTQFQISSNGAWVVYLADQNTNQVFELYSVSITGGVVTKLNAPLTLAGDVKAFQLTPDNSRVVYLADQENNNIDELYQVSIMGGMVTKLNEELVSTNMVNHSGVFNNFKITSDSSNVLYVAYETNTINTMELYKVSISGSTKTNLSSLSINDDVVDFYINPNGSNVVYHAYQPILEYADLYSVPMSGGTCIPLIGFPGDGSFIDNVKFNTDGNRVVFISNFEIGMAEDVFGSLNSVNELYSSPINGGGLVKLSGLLLLNAYIEKVINYRLTPDGTNVVFVSGKPGYTATPIFVTSITGGPITTLSSLTQPGYFYSDGNDDADRYEISPDGNSVLFLGNPYNDYIYKSSLDGSALVQMTAPINSDNYNDDLVNFKFEPVQHRLVYLGETNNSYTFELYSRSWVTNGSGYDSTPAPSSTINFGSIVVGNVATQTLIVSEIGTITLQVDGGAGMLSGNHPSNFQLINGPSFTIPNGGVNRTIQILCTPSASGTRTATLSFETTDPTRPVATYNLQATGTSSGAVPSIVFSSANYGVTEGNAGSQNLVLTVNRLGATGSPIVFTYSTSDGSAVATNDYVNVIDQQITMGSSQTSTNITVAIIGDTIPEPGASETFTVSLDVVSGANLGNPSTTTISITDNDMVIGGDTNVIAITGGLTVMENDAMGVSFNIARLVTDTNAFTVSYSIGGTATNNVDYTLSPQTISFGSNDVFKLVTVMPINDTNIEGNETVILSLVSGQGYLITNSPDATITILDDESGKLENGDFNGDGFSDILMQKKDTVSLLSGGNQGAYKLADTISLVEKNNKVVAANQVNGTNYLVIKVGRNLQVNAYNKTLSLSKSTPTFKLPKEAGSKVLASGDVNEDGIIDLISTKRGSGTVTFGPNYTDSSTLSDETALLDIDKNRLKSLGSIRGLYQSSGTNILVFQKGKKKPVWLGVLNAGTNSNTEVIINEFKTGFIPEGKIMGFSAANAIYYKKGIVTAGGLSYTNKPAINNLGKPVGPK